MQKFDKKRPFIQPMSPHDILGARFCQISMFVSSPPSPKTGISCNDKCFVIPAHMYRHPCSIMWSSLGWSRTVQLGSHMAATLRKGQSLRLGEGLARDLPPGLGRHITGGKSIPNYSITQLLKPFESINCVMLAW